MGLRVEKSEFEPEEFDRFEERLRESVEVLSGLLERPGFGQGPTTVGTELEMALIDADGRAKHESEHVLETLADERFTVELDQFNIECNTNPHELTGTALARMQASLDEAVEAVAQAAAPHGASVALVGILPTLTTHDLDATAMTNTPRYRALNAGLRRQRSGPFSVRVDGAEPLDLEWNDVTLEGANTSLQIHLRVDPERFADVHAGIQLATGPALAVAANSPTLLGHLLWDETRIALFKQAVDARTEHDPKPRVARVSFGTGWFDDALEPFADSVRLHRALLPVMSRERPTSAAENGGVPSLGELALHHGTVWRWNRAVYDPALGGHLRIEARALPSGPTVTDMVANTAFLLGLGLDLAEEGEELRRVFPFTEAENNFYRAAQLGVRATLAWPSPTGGISRGPAGDLAASLVDRARRALVRHGVDESQADFYLSTFFERASRGRTGAAWQRERLERLGVRYERTESLRRMLLEYIDRSKEGAPVHTWSTS